MISDKMYEATLEQKRIVILILGLLVFGLGLNWIKKNSSPCLSQVSNIQEEQNLPIRHPEKIYQRKKIVSINKASELDLKTIPGIGPVLAGRIVEHRQQYGDFQNIEELTQVKGIGPKKLQKISTYIKF